MPDPLFGGGDRNFLSDTSGSRQFLEFRLLGERGWLDALRASAGGDEGGKHGKGQQGQDAGHDMDGLMEWINRAVMRISRNFQGILLLGGCHIDRDSGTLGCGAAGGGKEKGGDGEQNEANHGIGCLWLRFGILAD